MAGDFRLYSSTNDHVENCGYTIMQLRDSKPFTPNLMLFKAHLLQHVSEVVAFSVALSDTSLKDYDRFLIVLDAAELGFCEANRIFNVCDFPVGPVLYIRVTFNEPGKY
jgi:hypothetical protein